MKIANVKGMVAKVLTVGFLAGAVAMAAPKAQAQEVFVGPGFYARHDFYERERIEAIRRHDAWVRAEEYRRFHHDRFYRGYR
jgi:hypothetical protein